MESKNQDLGPLFRQINDGLKRLLDNRLQDMQLTSAQIHVLGYLRCRRDMGQVTTQKDLENHLKVSHPTVVGIIHRLEEKGFLYSEIDTADRRMKNLYLTEQENEVFDEMERRREVAEASMLAGFTPGEREEIYQLLNRIIRNLEVSGQDMKQAETEEKEC